MPETEAIYEDYLHPRDQQDYEGGGWYCEKPLGLDAVTVLIEKFNGSLLMARAHPTCVGR